MLSRNRITLFLMLVLFAVPALLLAQEPVPTPLPQPDWQTEVLSLLKDGALVAFLVRALAWVLSIFVVKIPKTILPLALIVLSAAASFLNGFHVDNVWLAAGIVIVATVLRTVAEQVIKPMKLAGILPTLLEGSGNDLIVKWKK